MSKEKNIQRSLFSLAIEKINTLFFHSEEDNPKPQLELTTVIQQPVKSEPLEIEFKQAIPPPNPIPTVLKECDPYVDFAQQAQDVIEYIKNVRSWKIFNDLYNDSTKDIKMFLRLRAHDARVRDLRFRTAKRLYNSHPEYFDVCCGVDKKRPPADPTKPVGEIVNHTKAKLVWEALRLENRYVVHPLGEQLKASILEQANSLNFYTNYLSHLLIFYLTIKELAEDKPVKTINTYLLDIGVVKKQQQ